MRITIVGAGGGEVAGSAYHVETKRGSVLVDCGLFQGGRKSEALNRPTTTARQKPDALLVTDGEDGPREALAKKIQQQFKLPSKLPAMGEVIEL
jgi:metallo-beta-lactamase family protein